MPEARPIAAHGLIGDLHTAALVDTAGTVDWLCLPRFDSPSVFAGILDPDGGAWTIVPVCDATGVDQFYFPDSNALVTRFLTEDGVVEVQDFMPVETEQRRLVRRVVAVRGRMTLRTAVEPRFAYGRDAVRPAGDGRAVVFAHDHVDLTLCSSVPLEHTDTGVHAEFTVGDGDGPVTTFELRVGDEVPQDALAADAAHETFEETNRYWRDWIQQSHYRGRWREMVQRSALTLKLLTHGETGAILAAPTTALPEAIGEERNWDYRYVWARDAAFSAYALIRLGFTREAGAFVGWFADRLQHAEDGDQGPLSVLYDLDGSRTIEERELEHLRGHRDSRPVRVGNAATGQLQLDIYGEVIDSVYLYDKHGHPVSSSTWADLTRIAEWLLDNWDRPDEGIWEPRDGRADHTFSRLMCWVALERLVRMARTRGLPADLVRWTETRDAVYHQIMQRGFNADRGAFVGELDGDRLDASLLLMPMVKFISPTDPRFLGTLSAIENELVYDSLVFRYRDEVDDGLDGSEGTFSICSFWYVEALTRAGRLHDARLALEKMFTYANHLGLFAEQIGLTGEQLGNFPQAFTHLSLISAALNLDRALEA